MSFVGSLSGKELGADCRGSGTGVTQCRQAWDAHPALSTC